MVRGDGEGGRRMNMGKARKGERKKMMIMIKMIMIK